jgi:hypothetical protein
MAFKGLKNYGFISPDTSTPQGQLAGLFPLISSFTINVAGTEIKAQSFVNGTLQTTDSYVGTVETSVDFGVQSIDWITLQWLVGEYAEITPSLILPLVKSAEVPLTPFTITDADLTGAAVSDVQVTFVDSNLSNVVFLEVVTGSPTTYDEVQLTGGTLVFNSAAVGRSAKYMVRKTHSGIPTVGYAAAADTVDNLQFNGIIVGTRAKSVHVNIPQLTRNGTFAVTPGGGDQTLTYTANIKGSNRTPVRYALID